MGILEPGGTIIIVSECSEGMGSTEFISAQDMLCKYGSDKFMETLKGRGEALIDEWQTEMLLKPLRQGNIKLFNTNLSEKDLSQTYVEHVSSIRKEIQASITRQNSAEIAVIPEGPYVVPRFRPA